MNRMPSANMNRMPSAAKVAFVFIRVIELDL